MPKAFPEEFRRDVIAVARKGEAPCARPRRTSESPKAAYTAGSRSLTETTAPAPQPPARTNPRSSEKPESGSNSSSKKPSSCAAQLPTSPGTSTQNDLPPASGRCPHRWSSTLLPTESPSQ